MNQSREEAGFWKVGARKLLNLQKEVEIHGTPSDLIDKINNLQ